MELKVIKRGCFIVPPGQPCKGVLLVTRSKSAYSPIGAICFLMILKVKNFVIGS